MKSTIMAEFTITKSAKNIGLPLKAGTMHPVAP